MDDFQERVLAVFPDAKVELNQHAYSPGFEDIPYEIVVCGSSGPIYLAQDCSTHEEAWYKAARKIEERKGASWMISRLGMNR